MEEIIYWIWLSILDLRPIEKIKLLQLFECPYNIYKLTEKKLRKITNKEELLNIIKKPGKIEYACHIFRESKKQNIKIIPCNSIEYPQRLLDTYDYPIIIYVKGNIKLLNSENTISIVGSRKCSRYGEIVTKKISYLISQKGYTVISGLAKGIDSKAHQGTLISGGKTIAVLGCGINYIYPIENHDLYYAILKNEGTILSEYPLDNRPCKCYFPMRNRIIAGLSDKVLVTEATRKSGSIITANIALEQGKSIYAIPGNITNVNSEGTNNLIKDGAILVNSLEDIMEI